MPDTTHVFAVEAESESTPWFGGPAYLNIHEARRRLAH
jgi:hypothetical protein